MSKESFENLCHAVLEGTADEVQLEQFRAHLRAEAAQRRAYAFARFEVMACRKRNQRSRLVLDDALLATFADELEESSDDADQKLKVLEICMGRMTTRQRELIAARYGRGEAVQDIASRLSRSENAMAALFYRFRKLLADCVQSVLGNQARA